jgi:hypothetical protein
MLRTFVNLSSTPLGFEPDRLLTAKVGMSLRLFPDTDSRLALQRDIVASVARLPQVEAVSAANPLPFDALQVVFRYRRDGDSTDQGIAASQQSVMPGYLELAGIRTIQGRSFTEDDFTARLGGFPRLIAASYVLHRLLMPGHSPYSLSSLTITLLLIHMVFHQDLFSCQRTPSALMCRELIRGR